MISQKYDCFQVYLLYRKCDIQNFYYKQYFPFLETKICIPGAIIESIAELAIESSSESFLLSKPS
ncbi:MAG: hypothetical protein CM15mP102_16820 [Flavobacteriales bacterium]|nr:MAG: hypothetical protein CM15mP102_16820 [Flavobacteriales bacterium]